MATTMRELSLTQPWLCCGTLYPGMVGSHSLCIFMHQIFG